MTGVKDQNDRHDSWHHGGWGLKMIVWFLLVVLMFFVPNVIVSIYEILSKFRARAFLLVQVVLLLDATHNWNDSWVEKDEKKWYIDWLSYQSCITLLHDCGLNVFFIVVPMIRAFIFAIIA